VRHKIENWIEEIKLIDSLLPTAKDFPTPITAAALLTLRRYGKPALAFWRSYHDQDGAETSAPMQTRNLIRELKWGSGGLNADVTGKILVVFDEWVNDPSGAVSWADVVCKYDGNTVLQLFKAALTKGA